MTLQIFKDSLHQTQPPHGLNPYLQAMWYDAKDNWEKAHQLVQDMDTTTAAHVHAYLHRKEGDNGNANYWYRRAGTRMCDVSLAEEWDNIVADLLKL